MLDKLGRAPQFPLNPSVRPRSKSEPSPAGLPTETSSLGLHSTAELDGLNLRQLRDLAGVKKPGLLKRIGKRVSGWVSGVKLALAVGPTLGHTVLAKAMADLESTWTGKPALAPLDWLRERRPEAYVNSLGTLLQEVSGPTEMSQGLSPTDLLAVDEHFYRSLAPVEGKDGGKTIAPYLQELAKAPFRKPGEPRPAFVFLGQNLQGEADSVSELWNSPQRPIANPFPDVDQRSLIWHQLEVESKKGLLPVFVDVDGDFRTFTGTEFVAKRTLASLGERNNSLGDGFSDSGMYFRWLQTRLESTTTDLLPYFAEKNPALAKKVEGFKETLTPPWLDGKAGIGPWPALEKVREIPAEIAKVKDQQGEGAWIDSIASLDRDLLTSVQTHWIKLLREIPREVRQGLTAPLPEAFLRWNLQEPGSSDFDQVAPSDAPILDEIGGRHDLQQRKRPYDRSVALKEVLDHSLDGLGIAERRSLLGSVKLQAKDELPRIQTRELRLREALGSRYEGLDVASILDGTVSRTQLRQGLKALRDFADLKPREPQSLEARRHEQLLSFLFDMEHRYGEVDQIMTRLHGDFEREPLGVSEFFIPPANSVQVSPLRQAAPTAIRLGNPNDPNPVKMSQVFEGGGGRGFAYVECLKQFENSFVGSAHGYEIDELVGTSAGTLMAVLLAAGYKPDELRQVLESVDFTSFNGDGIWMMGGVDPKVRGVDRNGLFSTQKMYQTFSKLLSDKLGIEGRPIFFRDLPHKLKIVTTLVNSDMPEDHPLRECLDGDGRMTWSSESTPNVDVVGALVASAAVPGFFQAPQMLVAQPGEDGEVKRARLQMVDGGVVDNLSISSATDEGGERALVVLPSHTRTRDPETGEWVGLDTLNFDTSNLDLIDAHNRELYGKFMPAMDSYLQAMKAQGAERVVMAFNLATEKMQPLPALQGSHEELSLKALIQAQELGMPVLSKEKGDALINRSLRPPTVLTNVLGGFFDTYVDNRPREGDGLGKLHRDERGFHFRVGQTEEADLFESVRSTGAAALSASPGEYAQRRFEKPHPEDVEK